MINRVKKRLKRLWHPQKSPPILASQAAYDLWAADYPPNAHNAFMSLEEQVMLAHLPALEGARVLDLACGSGRWGHILKAKGATTVYSADNSRAMLQRGTMPHPTEASMVALPFRDASLDGILCSLAIGHLPNTAMRLAIGEMGRVLKPGGWVLLSDVHPHQAWNGARRTFSDPKSGAVFGVEHHIHSYEGYHRAIQQSGLNLADVVEASEPDHAPPVLLMIRLKK